VKRQRSDFRFLPQRIFSKQQAWRGAVVPGKQLILKDNEKTREISPLTTGRPGEKDERRSKNNDFIYQILGHKLFPLFMLSA
jgi:hypothetical protein